MQQQIISKCLVRKLKRVGAVIQEKDAIADYFKVFCKEIKASWGSNSRERYNSRLFQCFVRKLKRAGTAIQEKDAIAD